MVAIYQTQLLYYVSLPAITFINVYYINSILLLHMYTGYTIISLKSGIISKGHTAAYNFNILALPL